MTDEYSLDDVLRILRVTPDSLKRYLRAALFPVSLKQPTRRFSFHDLLLLKTAKGLCDAGIPVVRIRRVLESLKRQLPADQQLSTVRIYVDGRRVVVWDGTGRWQPDSGQFLLNLDAQQIAPTRPLRRSRTGRGEGWTAEQWLERASVLETDSPEEARHAYEEALARDPTLAVAHINLGWLYHQSGAYDRAAEHYRAAIEQDPLNALGHFNLAVLLQERRDLPGAEAAYRAAITREPAFRDAHHNLALLYEGLGRRADAIRHYAIAKKLLRQERGKRKRPSSH